MIRIVLSCGAVLIAAGLLADVGYAADAAAKVGEGAPAEAKLGELPAGRIGVASCRGSGCHGRAVPESEAAQEPSIRLAAWQTSFTVWSQSDPHRNAYFDLFTPRSKRMVSLLAGRDLAPQSTEYLAVLKSACIDCHSTGNFSPEEAVVLSGGVSCESCHGPASGWLETHSQEPGGGAGLTKLVDLSVRAQVCVACHVGVTEADSKAGHPSGANGGRRQPGQEVNHRLIAAGHPRLVFELSSYMAALPAHWDRKQDARRATPARGSFPAELWLHGQRSVARTAVGLVRQRVTSERFSGDWPELAEFDCYACHHDVAASNFRREGGAAIRGGLRPGQWSWASWNTQFVDQLVPAGAEPIGMDALRTALARPWPDRAVVTREADRVLMSLDGLGTGSARDTLHTVVLAERRAGFVSWDAATQWYLAAVTAEQALTVETPQRKRLREQLQAVRLRLEFETDNAPGSGQTATRPVAAWDSPIRFDPTDREFLDLVQLVQRELKEGLVERPEAPVARDATERAVDSTRD
jgi:hypothetical protein